MGETWTVTETHCFPDPNGRLLFLQGPYDFWRMYCPIDWQPTSKFWVRSSG